LNNTFKENGIFILKSGNNHFMVVANSHKEGVNIKSIELFLKYRDNPDVAPIQVPFSVIVALIAGLLSLGISLKKSG